MHLPFDDRIEAGRYLAAELSRYPIAADALVVALPGGGVPVGFSVAERLHLTLDVVGVCRVGVPWQQELTMGAVAGGTRVLDEQLIQAIGVPAADVLEICAREQADTDALVERYRGGRPAHDLEGRYVILVDDGMSTGRRMLAAARHIRSLRPAHLTVAVPVSSDDAYRLLRREADDLVCVIIPERMYAIGEWYRDFSRVSARSIHHLLEQAHRQELTVATAG